MCVRALKYRFGISTRREWMRRELSRIAIRPTFETKRSGTSGLDSLQTSSAPSFSSGTSSPSSKTFVGSTFASTSVEKRSSANSRPPKRDKKDSKINDLSGGMKRRVLIAKALSHEPDILFLDEPTAGVDVELRKDMWKTIKNLQKSGVTIILTTHYIEEAELMANRIAVINNGKILLIDKKDNLIDRMSKKTLTINTNMKINKIDDSLFKFNLRIGRDKKSLEYDYSPNKKKTGIHHY